jgi:hypothetical protein
MTQQGGCVLPPDGSGRVLDGLAGLEKGITPAVVEQVLWETKRVNPRACKRTHEIMLWVVLAMGILTDLPIRQVFKHARRLRMGERLPIDRVCAWPGNVWGFPPCGDGFRKWCIPWPIRTRRERFTEGCV